MSSVAPTLAKLAFAIAILSIAAPALAIDTSYYSYDGFAETVDAFKLVALIFADPRYATLVVIIATAGISLGALLASIRGSGMGLVAFGFQMLVGIGLYAGFIASTGTVNVYDPVRNAYQPVGGVPNLLVLVAGTTNLMERALVETIDDNTVDPDSKIAFGAGGHSFDLFFNAVSPRGPMTDTFLEATIKDYVRQCYPVARVSSAYGIDDDKLFRTTTDLPSAFAAMAGPATFSTVYTAADKAGTTMGCDQAWQHISQSLANPDLFAAYAAQICGRTGFDVTQAGQLQRCKAQLGEMGGMMMGTPLSLQTLLTDVLLGTSVGDVLFEDSPATAARVMANRSVLSSGLATMSVANEWMPTIRSVVFGIMLFMVPIALLFILTPINLRVATFALGLFVFVALWGVIDAGIYQLTLGRAEAALGEMRGNALGTNAWLLAPSSAQRALAIFGSFRSAAAGMAAAFVFTVFRFSGEVFNAISGGSASVQGQAIAAAAPLATSEGYASALEAQASAYGTATRRDNVSSFGDFGERTSFVADRGFGAAGVITGESPPGAPGVPALGMGRVDAARELGGLAPALAGRSLNDPATARAVQANAATAAIHQYAEQDVLRTLGTAYFGEGETGERAFAAFAQNMVQWRAFGDERAYDMMMQSGSRFYERGGYSSEDATLKASGIIAQASADPTFGKLIANAYDQEAMLRNDLTGAQVEAGAMAGRRDSAPGDVARTERRNVGTEQGFRGGTNASHCEAARVLGLSLGETARRIGFIDALSGEARSSAVTSLARTTGRSEADVLHAVEAYGIATQAGTADGATAEIRREGTSVYARASDTAGFDVAERAGKLDAQREVGHGGTRGTARTAEQRHQADQAGFAGGAAAAGVSTREAARLDAFIHTLAGTAGNQLDMAQSGAAGIADRARNERLGHIVENERLTRVQSMLRAHGVQISRRQIALDQNGDFSFNLTPALAQQMHRAGLINGSQAGALSHGGHARLSLADHDMLVSSSVDFTQSGRSDTSTRFEAGKQAGPDTIEQFLGGGAEGHAVMANWLRGGFEMDSIGQWRLKPQVADTLERDITAMIAQTGWQRSLSRSASHQVSQGTAVGAELSASVGAGGIAGGLGSKGASSRPGGTFGGSVGLSSSDTGDENSRAQATIDIVNYDVRNSIASAESAAANSHAPEQTFTTELAHQIFGQQGLRNRYLEQADAGRGTSDLTAPITSWEQKKVLDTGRFTGDRDTGWEDGNPEFKKR